MELDQSVPIPHDIPLPLPAPEPLLVVLLVFSFLVHIIFVNLMFGGSILTLVFEWMGLKRPGYDDLAKEIAKTVTVNKSLAVVLGVAPLLLLNVLYTVYFYSANAMTGIAWIAVIPLVTMAFLLLYLHKYSWQRMARHKGIHLMMIAAACLIFLAIPLVFLTNINLMLFPERWADVKGFLSALMLPNVLPRYLHFIAASMAVTSLFLVGWFGRKRFRFQEKVPALPLPGVKKMLYSIALGVTGAQFIIGPLVYLTLPSHGVSGHMNLVILTGIATAIPAMVWMWREVDGSAEHIGQHLMKIAIALTVTVVCMGTGRHLYREEALGPHKQAMAEKTQAYMARVASAKEGLPVEVDAGGLSGEKVFKQYCVACHAEDKRLVGPPVNEIRGFYVGNPQGIVDWVRAPGRRREDYPPMPAMPLPEDELRAVADFLLRTSSDQ